MPDKRKQYARLIREGVSNSKACRQLKIDRNSGHWWKNGGSLTRNSVTRVIESIIDRQPARPESGRCLSESERVKIADGVYAGKPARRIAAELGRAVSTVSRELQRNACAEDYRPHAAQAMMQARRPRPKARLLERDGELRVLVQAISTNVGAPNKVTEPVRVGGSTPTTKSNCSSRTGW